MDTTEAGKARIKVLGGIMNLKSYSIRHIRQAANDFGIPFKAALISRKEALKTWIHKQENDIIGTDYDAITLHYKLSDVEKAKKEISLITVELNRGEAVNPDEITPEMIQRAKDYPVDRLIDFSRGRAICPFHNSKDADLSHDKKHNRVKCFGQCNKSWDSISILMERDGLSFKESVTQLQG